MKVAKYKFNPKCRIDMTEVEAIKYVDATSLAYMVASWGQEFMEILYSCSSVASAFSRENDALAFSLQIGKEKLTVNSGKWVLKFSDGSFEVMSDDLFTRLYAVK